MSDNKSTNTSSGCGSCILVIICISYIPALMILGGDCADDTDIRSNYRSDLSKRIDYITQRLNKLDAKLRKQGHSERYIENELRRVYLIWKGNLTHSQRLEVSKLENQILSEF